MDQAAADFGGVIARWLEFDQTDAVVFCERFVMELLSHGSVKVSVSVW